ncbi:MSHA biogenesis protein MshN [Pseudoduganella namucuonensis]|uniref:MSHA biogenesis protein MshN n=2 Tax=Pseudoduganella namucuonensis TaxID=1035707 RepID=A0A1I7L5T4_9BURK|nr:MSHA biogenesis protein MshN [Pseudoduganella namucuonensis]
MSLINKMLQDLDARGGGAGRQGAAAAMRAVAPSSGGKQRTVLAAGAGAAVVALAAGGWFGWKYLHRSPGAANPQAIAGAAARPQGQPGLVPAGQAQSPQPGTVAAAPAQSLQHGATAAGPGQPVQPGAVAAEPGRSPAAVGSATPPGGGGGAAAAGSAASPLATASGAEGATAANAAAEPQRETKAEARKRRLAEEKAAAELAAELKAARKKAREARAEADALAAATASGRPVSASKAAPAVAADRPARLAAKPAARSSEPESARPVANGVTVTSQQQADNAYRRALLALQEARVNDAISGLEQAVYTFPRHEAARQTLIGLLLENRRNDEAIRHLQLGLGLDPKQPQMAMLLARLQIEKGGPAIDTLLRTLPYAGSHADYVGFLAGALQRAQRHKEAVEQYQAALRLMPQNGVWWMGLGISLQAEKRNAEAQDAYTRAKASGSLSPELTGFVERKLQQLGR